MPRVSRSSVLQCRHCGGEFSARPKVIYCSSACGTNARRAPDPATSQREASATSERDSRVAALAPDSWKGSKRLARKRRAGRVQAVKEHKHSLKREGALNCAACGWAAPAALVGRGGDMMVHAHHVVPVACGGSDDPANIVPLCPNHHALAHRLGSQRRGVWYGADSITALLLELRLVETDPHEWRLLRAERVRRYAPR